MFPDSLLDSIHRTNNSVVQYCPPLKLKLGQGGNAGNCCSSTDHMKLSGPVKISE